MYSYMLYGMKITSDIEFGQLVGCEDDRSSDVIVESGDIPQWLADKEREGIQYEFGDEISWLANRTCYLYMEKGSRITYRLKEGGNPMYLRTYILGWGISMLALQRGIIAMHCSVVADEHGAVLISGRSGSGKSTLTAALLEEGYRLMADDMALVGETDERIMVSPAFPYQKLCRDAALEQGYRLEELQYISEEKDKFLVPYRGEFSTESVPVKGFIMLGITGGDKVICEEAKGLQKFQIIVNNQFLQGLLGKDKYKPEIGQKCLNIASKIPVYYLLRPEGADTIQEVRDNAFEILNIGNCETL